MSPDLAPLIKAIRIEMRCTQAEFAQILEVPISTYKSWEYRVCLPSLRNMAMIETRLGTDAAELVEVYTRLKLK